MRMISVAAAFLFLASACGGGPEPRLENGDTVVLIVVDTMRGDRFGAAGYRAARTPILDALAAEGMYFDDAMTPVPVTLPAVSSLLTGQWPWRHGVRDNGGFQLEESFRTLAESFLAAGWRTRAVVGSAVLSASTGIAQGFEQFEDKFDGAYPIHDARYESLAPAMALDRRRADRVTDLALAAAEEVGEDPLFLFVHYFDVHAYYDPPPGFAELHPGRPYDGEISFVDAEIGRLLGGLKGRKVMTVVVADHGEGLGEHGEYEHGFLLHQSTLHIPMILHGPGLGIAEPIHSPTSLVDIVPTLRDHFGLDDGGGPLDGRALFAGMDDVGERDLYAETLRTRLIYDWSELRALRRGSRKYILGPRDELYDLALDPEELQVLEAESEPDMRARLLELESGDLPEAWLPQNDRAPDAVRAEQLAALGYASSGGSNRGTLPRSLPHPADMLPAWQRRQAARAALRVAQQAIREGDWPGALTQLNARIGSGDSGAELFLTRSVVLAQLGRAEEAAVDLESALRVDPAYIPALKRKSEELLRAGAFEAARICLDQWIVADPADADARYNRGVLAVQSDNAAEARRQFEEFLKLAPQDPRAAQVRSSLEMD